MARSIAYKLSTALAVVVVAGGALMGIAATQVGTSLLMQAATTQLAQESRVAATRLRDIFDSAQRELQFLARSPAVPLVAEGYRDDALSPPLPAVRARAQVEEVFAALLVDHPWYTELGLISARQGGRELVRVEQVDGRIQRIAEEALQRNGAGASWLERVEKDPGEVYVSITDLRRPPGRAAAPHRPTIRFGLRFEHEGEPLGIVTISVDARRVFEAARDLISPGVALYLANRQGDYLYRPDRGESSGFDGDPRYRLQEDFPGAASVLETGKPRVLEHAVPRAATEPLVAHVSRIPILKGAPTGRALLLLLTMPRSLIAKEVNAARGRSAALILPFLLAAIVVVVWTVRIFISPLERVTSEVSRFVPGGHRRRLPEERRDEIGALARGFSRMADRLERQVAELEAERLRFQSLFETAADAIVIIDQDGTVEQFNGAAVRLFGYAAAEVIGHNVRMLMPEPDRTRHNDYIERYLAGGEPHIIGSGRRVTALRKDGRTVPMHLAIGEFTLDGRRKFTGILHLMRT